MGVGNKASKGWVGGKKEEGVTVDLDASGHIVGIEILDASRRMSSQELNKVAIENLLPG